MRLSGDLICGSVIAPPGVYRHSGFDMSNSPTPNIVLAYIVFDFLFT